MRANPPSLLPHPKPQPFLLPSQSLEFFECLLPHTYGFSIACVVQVQALISSGTPQLQPHPKFERSMQTCSVQPQYSGVKLTTTNGAGSNAAHVAAAAFPGLQPRYNTQVASSNATEIIVPKSFTDDFAGVLQLLLSAGAPVGALDGNAQG
jgi:hypothetical protein